MPNHVTTNLIITGTKDELTILRKTIIVQEKEGNYFDFNKIIPMPILLKNTGSGHCNFDGVAHTAWFDILTALRDHDSGSNP